MLNVVKADGTIEPFSEEKVLASIKRAGIPHSLQSLILSDVKKKAYDNMQTWEIYHHIMESLGKSDAPFTKSRYSLKQAIMLLGPTGYPFEDFISQVLSNHGYQTTTRQILMGRCVSHEVDVIAEKDGRRSMIEAKFHNSPGSRSDVHVAMYTHARFEDIKNRQHLDDAWIVTNTKVTIDAITYAQCVGMKILSWSYPEGESLRDMIEKSHLHPVTMLTSLAPAHKVQLLNNHVILCKDICKNHKVLDILPLTKEEKDHVIAEVRFICHNEFHAKISDAAIPHHFTAAQ
jgi:Holliday junction resolvase-like predicted endonuclease